MKLGGQSRLRHYWQLLCERFAEHGLGWTLRFYWKRMHYMLYAKRVFGRFDINVVPGARISGVEHMQIGSDFAAARDLWMEAVDSYPHTGQTFTPKLVIGDRVNLGEYVHIGCNSYVEIGDDVLMGSKIYITDHNHGVYRGASSDSPSIPPIKRRLTEGEHVVIGARCWIGEFVTILPGVTIGEGCIIGSHSTVTHDIPANSIAVGCPARVLKRWEENSRQWIRIGFDKS